MHRACKIHEWRVNQSMNGIKCLCCWWRWIDSFGFDGLFSIKIRMVRMCLPCKIFGTHVLFNESTHEHDQTLGTTLQSQLHATTSTQLNFQQQLTETDSLLCTVTIQLWTSKHGVGSKIWIIKRSRFGFKITIWWVWIDVEFNTFELCLI